MSTGWAIAADQSEYDPISHLQTLPPPAVPYNVIRPAASNYLVTYEAATETLTAQDYTVIDLFTSTLTDRYGNVSPYDPTVIHVYKVTSDLYLVDTQDESLLLDPVTLSAVAASSAYTILPTPATLKLAFADAHNLVSNHKLPGFLMNSTAAITNAEKITFADEKPSYLVGPYSYDNAGAADYIELSGNLSEASFSNLSITAALPAYDLTSTTGTLIDETGNNTGTLHGFALTGNTSNWTTGIASGNCAPFVVPNTPHYRNQYGLRRINHCVIKCNSWRRMEQQQ